VLEATLAAMDVAPADVVAWIGPAIGPRAFEVGRDVLDAFVTVEPADEACFAPHAAGKWLADLPGLARRRLARAGVRDVAGGTWCTVEDGARFHSWRRERSAGRMATAIAIRPR
jgi:copper oxidase (laccase) domain-containing protein